MFKNKRHIRSVRYGVQLFFLLFTAFIGYRFYLFVRHFETAGLTPFVERPDSVDAFLPIGGLMAFKYVLMTGIVEPFHPAGLILFTAILGVSLVFKKSFCGWICPVGTVSQYAWMAGEKITGRNFKIEFYTDMVLRSLKYFLLGMFIVLIIVAMAPSMMVLFMITDYYKMVDVRMMKFFTEMTQFTFWFLVVLAGLSVLYKNFWCRYLCPYGALLGIASFFSPFKIRRDESKCIHCHACTRHCPTLLDVESKEVVRSAECYGCLSCVSRCPAEGALSVSFHAPKKIKTFNPYIFALALIAFFYLVIGIGMLTGNWKSKIPYEEYQRLIPEVQKEYAERGKW